MARKTTKNTTKNAFTLRIIDPAVLAIFDDLFATGIWESKNVLTNKILAAGIKDFAHLYLDKEIKNTKKSSSELLPDTVNKEIRQTRQTAEDIFVIMTTMERMVASLFNAKVAELSGEKISVDEITSGILSDLPDEFKVIKEEVIRLRAGRVDK